MSGHRWREIADRALAQMRERGFAAEQDHAFMNLIDDWTLANRDDEVSILRPSRDQTGQEADLERKEDLSMCNLYNDTTNQEAIFSITRRWTGSTSFIHRSMSTQTDRASSARHFGRLKDGDAQPEDAEVCPPSCRAS